MVLEQDEWYVITSAQTPTRIVKIFERITLPDAYSSLQDKIKCYSTYIENGKIKGLNSNSTVYVYITYDPVCSNYYKLDNLLKADKYLIAEQYREVVNSLVSPEELLNEAKSRYPVGTRYWPAHLYSNKTDSVVDLSERDENFVVSGDQKFYIEGANQIFLKNPDGGYFDSERNGEIYNQILYAKGTWACKLTSKSNTMTNFNTENKDELLARLRAKFPIGTRYIPLNASEEYEGIYVIKREISEHGAGRYEGGIGFVYIDGREAKVMPYGDEVDYQAIEREALSRYPAGTQYLRLECSGEVGRSTVTDGRFHWLERRIDGRNQDLLEMGDGYVYVDGKWAEIVPGPENSSDNPDSILEEARRRFPLGSKYIPISLKGKPYDDVHTVDHEPQFLSSIKDRMDCGIGYCYVDGIWAKSVTESSESPTKKERYIPTEEEVLARYPKGTYYLPLLDDGSVGETPQVSNGIYDIGGSMIWVNAKSGTGYIYDINRQKWADVVPNPNTVGIDEVQYPKTPQESYFPVEKLVEKKAVLTKQKASINQVEELPLLKIKSF